MHKNILAAALLSFFLFFGSSAQVLAQSVELDRGEANFGTCEYRPSGSGIPGILLECEKKDQNFSEQTLRIYNRTGKYVSALKMVLQDSSGSVTYGHYHSPYGLRGENTAQPISIMPNGASYSYANIEISQFKQVGDINAQLHITPLFCDQDYAQYNNYAGCTYGDTTVLRITAKMTVAVPQPQISTSSISFGDVAVGQSVTKTFTITNNSSRADYSPKFTTEGTKGDINFNELEHILNKSGSAMNHKPGESRTWKVTFTPKKAGAQLVTLVFQDESKDIAQHLPTYRITITGMGTVASTGNTTNQNTQQSTSSTGTTTTGTTGTTTTTTGRETQQTTATSTPAVTASPTPGASATPTPTPTPTPAGDTTPTPTPAPAASPTSENNDTSVQDKTTAQTSTESAQQSDGSSDVLTTTSQDLSESDSHTQKTTSTATESAAPLTTQQAAAGGVAGLSIIGSAAWLGFNKSGELLSILDRIRQMIGRGTL